MCTLSIVFLSLTFPSFPLSPSVSLELATVAQKFGMPQPDAAKQLGISLTSLKLVCRKLGLQKWPYRRPGKSAGSTSALSRKEKDAEGAQSPFSFETVLGLLRYILDLV